MYYVHVAAKSAKENAAFGFFGEKLDGGSRAKRRGVVT